MGNGDDIVGNWNHTDLMGDNSEEEKSEEEKPRVVTGVDVGSDPRTWGPNGGHWGTEEQKTVEAVTFPMEDEKSEEPKSGESEFAKMPKMPKEDEGDEDVSKKCKGDDTQHEMPPHEIKMKKLLQGFGNTKQDI